MSSGDDMEVPVAGDGAVDAQLDEASGEAGVATPDQTRQQLNQALTHFWRKQLRDVHSIHHSLADLKNHPLPLARIKKIMKSDEDVRMISSEAPVLFAKACELFILELTQRAWVYSEAHKRRTLQHSDITSAIVNHENEVYEFLMDNIPAHVAQQASDGTAVLPPVDPSTGLPNLGNAAPAAPNVLYTSGAAATATAPMPQLLSPTLMPGAAHAGMAAAGMPWVPPAVPGAGGGAAAAQVHAPQQYAAVQYLPWPAVSNAGSFSLPPGMQPFAIGGSGALPIVQGAAPLDPAMQAHIVQQMQLAQQQYLERQQVQAGMSLQQTADVQAQAGALNKEG